MFVQIQAFMGSLHVQYLRKSQRKSSVFLTNSIVFDFNFAFCNRFITIKTHYYYYYMTLLVCNIKKITIIIIYFDLLTKSE